MCPCNFLDEGLHRHSLRDQARSFLTHRTEQAQSGCIDSCHVPHVDFHRSAGDPRAMPGVFGFGNPGASESAFEMQATERAILPQCDSQHFGLPMSSGWNARARPQVSPPDKQLRANGLNYSAGDSRSCVLLPGSEHGASNRAVCAKPEKSTESRMA